MSEEGDKDELGPNAAAIDEDIVIEVLTSFLKFVINEMHMKYSSSLIAYFRFRM